jgi:hypothetical protein
LKQNDNLPERAQKMNVEFDHLFLAEDSDYSCMLHVCTSDYSPVADDDGPPSGWAADITVYVQDLDGPIFWSMRDWISGKPSAEVVAEVEAEVRRVVRAKLTRLQAAITACTGRRRTT